MFLFKINFRRIVTVLASIMLFFSVAFIGNIPATAAEATTRDVTNLDSIDDIVDAVSDTEREADKASRQQKQAMRSQMATPNQDGEGIADKLNLDEALPRGTKKLGEQIKGNEPINNETRP